MFSDKDLIDTCVIPSFPVLKQCFFLLSSYKDITYAIAAKNRRKRNVKNIKITASVEKFNYFL